MSAFDLANEAAILSAGTNARWTSDVILTDEDPPVSIGTGRSDLTAVQGWVLVAPRQVPGRRTGYLLIGVYDASADYTVTIDGNIVTVLAAEHSTEPEALTKIAAAVNADVTVGPLISATALDSDDNDAAISGNDPVTVRLRSTTTQGDADWSLEWAATAGAVAGTADAVSCDVDVYVVPAGDAAPSVWVRLGDPVSVSSAGAMIPIVVASYSEHTARIYAITTVGGDGINITPTVNRSLGSMGTQQIGV